MVSRKLTTCVLSLSAVQLLLFTHLLVVEGRSNKDAPPEITEVSPATIGDPESYIQIAKTSPTTSNELKCVASNADEVYWMYKAELSDEISTQLPSVMEQLPQEGTDSVTTTSRTLTDRNSLSDSTRPSLNGFYQCFAKSNYVGNEYQALTPLIQLVYPAVNQQEKVIGPLEAQTLPGGEASPTLTKPYKLPCMRKNDFSLSPPNAVNLPQAAVKFRWEIRYTDNTEIVLNLDGSNYKGRVKMDPRTGDLYFAVLNTEDSQPGSAGVISNYYQCKVTIGSQDSVITNKLYLSVAAFSGDPAPLELLYPTTESEKAITCVENRECRLTAIFGGAPSIGVSPTIVPPSQSSVIYKNQSYGASFDSGTTEDSGSWVFKMEDGQTEKSIVLQVTVLAFPKLTSKVNFSPKSIVFSGTEVVYECKPDYAKPEEVAFYINGEQVTVGKPPHVIFSNSDPTRFTIQNIQRNQSASIACIATNNAGTMFERAELTVFDAPIAELHPKEPYQVGGTNDTDLVFNCSFRLDEKTNPESVKLWWKSNHTDLQDKKLTSDDGFGVADVESYPFNERTYTIQSKLTVLANSRTEYKLDNTQWWCQCRYTVLSIEVDIANTTRGFLEVLAPAPPPTPAPYVFPYTYVIVGAVLGLLFLILLVILIHCYVQKNKGEQYRVDENERKAGHNPEEEMKAYGYVDYNRPDQNPVKGSRASMNFSERPLESDHGSMDEYGDIDTGRFNEDGSFIGEYRGQNNHRNQADV